MIDDLKIYLPKFLSAESEKELFEGLKDFPSNIDTRLYTNYLAGSEHIYQGDGLKDLLVINLPNSTIRPAPCMVLSNTCDIAIENLEKFTKNIVYAPIFNLEKYRISLLENSGDTKEQIDSHINSIKQQQKTQIFYLPKIESVLDDSIVFLDKVCHLPSKLIERKDLKERRLFTLSDYGAYLFLLKLSIHFTRIRDKVERKSVSI